MGPTLRLIAVLALALAPASAVAAPPTPEHRVPAPRGEWTVIVEIGDVMSFAGWDESVVDVAGGLPEREGRSTLAGETGLGHGFYLAGSAGLDPHWQIGGFLYYAGLGPSVARSDADDVFHRSVNVVALGVSVAAAERLHPVVRLGAALDAGLAVLLPRNVALPMAGGGLELDEWLGLFLFPRLHLDIRAVGAADPGVGFFWDFGPMFVPIARGAGAGSNTGTDLRLSYWTVCLQMVLGFSLGV
jgi:opacity protein-like surface antigen